MQNIIQIASEHSAVITGLSVHLLHTAWNFWKSVGGRNGLKQFYFSGSTEIKTIENKTQ